MKIFIRLLFLAGWIGCSAVGQAQETSGRLQGQVTDTSGHALAGVTILAMHQPTGTRYSAVTSADGYYLLPGLRIGGPYTLDISYAGMIAQHVDGIQVTLEESPPLSYTLHPQIQQLAAAVVTGDRRNQAGRYGAGLNISKDQLASLPSTSRSLQDFTRMVPQGSKDNTFLGSSFRYNNFSIDGAINNDAIGFAPSLGGQTGTSGQPGGSTRNNPFSLDAIEALEVELAPYDVKLGNFTGGSINAVTRSGTNTLEGSFYAYGRNAAITGPDNGGDGRRMPSAFHELQTGFHFGFPLVKDKMFFFTNEEITRRQDPIMQEAGSLASGGILSAADARQISDTLKSRYNINPGTYNQYNIYSNSNKYFNRLDWNLDACNQLTVRNNTVSSEAVNLERDQQDFRFSGIAYQQVNNQSSTVAELKSHISNTVSNSLIAGYSTMHDYRNPLSNPAIPQVQIVGNTPGTTIFLGTDREASIFDMKQRTVEFTDNVTVNLGRHRLLFGTHNEFYNINYGFVNSWNGRVDYPSIQSFLNNEPVRVRASYNYTDNTRDYILGHPGAVFQVNFFSGYAQDEIRISDRFTVTPGLRADYSGVPHKQTLSTKTQDALTDPNYGTTYTYTPLSQITNNYLGVVQMSPRIGFRADLNKDRSLVLRGGAGIFTGRIPFAWLGYAFYNNGDTYGAYDQNTSNGTSVFAPGTDPLRYDPKLGASTFAAQNGQVVNNRNAGQTQVDAVNNHFVMPQVFRTSIALDYKGPLGIKYTFEGIFTKTMEDVMFQQVNVKDNPSYYAYDTATKLQRQPIYPSGGVNPAFANAYEMSNTKQGARFSLTAKVSKSFPYGLDIMAAYTYGQSKDISNGIRNSMESNYQLNQALNPNNPGLAYSNFDIRHRIVANGSYRIAWSNRLATSVNLFVSAQSGAPYTYGFVNYTIQSTPQQVSLAYIPNESEAVNFFQNYTDKNGNMVTAASQAQAFNQFIDANSYLRNHRGNFTQRNGARTPWNNDADIRFRQDFMLGKKQMISFTWDIINLTNLLDKKWGREYFVPDTYNSTASVGLVPYIPAQASQGYPIYQFVNPGRPYSVDFMNSRWQMEAGVRYSF
jgi:Carboxypeptidase regulatory-like domain